MGDDGSLNKYFEEAKHISTNGGIEFWHARDLMPLLGYTSWQTFEDVIQRAARSAMNSGEDVDNHFKRAPKMVKIGSNASREIADWKLDRYACYLIAQNADPTKEPVALAQTYFAVQTRKQEISRELESSEKRLFIRDQVADRNKELLGQLESLGKELRNLKSI